MTTYWGVLSFFHFDCIYNLSSFLSSAWLGGLDHAVSSLPFFFALEHYHKYDWNTTGMEGSWIFFLLSLIRRELWIPATILDRIIKDK